MVDAAPQIEPDQHYHFVTGKLAASALGEIVRCLASEHSFSYSIEVLPITVAALITPKWLERHIRIPSEATHVVLPGFIEIRDDASIIKQAKATVLIGPKDCRELPEWFGGMRQPPDLSQYDIEIIAEINHVPRLSVEQFLFQSQRLSADGANRIDIGCDPSNRCGNIADYVRAAVDMGLKVSIDTFDHREARDAIAAGASLWLSVNSTNRDAALDCVGDHDCEVVAIPDVPDDLDSLRDTASFLSEQGVRYRMDPILEPIGADFFASLQRYAVIRDEYADTPMMMGIGNVTELTDVDSAGVNFLLLAICQELRIESVLTTQVINWARSSVRECDIGRRLVKHSIDKRVPPKRLSDDLVMLRDPKLRPFPEGTFGELSQTVKDNNYRLFAQDEQIHLVSADLHLSDADPFRLFEQLLLQSQSDNVDASHAFYLGYEMAKAVTALQLGKQYNQDQSLDWGQLTVPEDLHRIARTSRHRKS